MVGDKVAEPNIRLFRLRGKNENRIQPERLRKGLHFVIAEVTGRDYDGTRVPTGWACGEYKGVYNLDHAGFHALVHSQPCPLTMLIRSPGNYARVPIRQGKNLAQSCAPGCSWIADSLLRRALVLARGDAGVAPEAMREMGLVCISHGQRGIHDTRPRSE